MTGRSIERSSWSRAVAVLALAASLPGCGANAVRVESARAVHAQGSAAVAASTAYFDSVEQRRRDAAAALVASDPSCLPVTPLQIQVPSAAGADAGAPLCPAEGRTAPGHRVFAIDIGTSPRTVLAPRVAVLAAVADYVDALALILDQPGSDVSAELARFAEQAERVRRFAGFVTGDDLPDVAAAAASEQGQALVALIAFAEELAREAKQVTAVRRLVAERGATVDRALAVLRDQVATWGEGAARNADDLYGNALMRSYMRQRRSLTAEQREQLAGRIFAARESAAHAPERAAKVVEAIDLAAAAQRGLREALAGRLTAEQRRAAARLNLDRVTRALGLVASLADPL